MFVWNKKGFSLSDKPTGVLPLNMGTSRKERMGKQYINRKWIPTLLEKK